MAKDGTMRGGQRVGAGRKSKALTDKIADGRLNGAVVLPEPAEIEGADVPPVKEYLKAAQKNGKDLCAEEVYRDTWNWLNSIGCAGYVSPQTIERYAMCVARWLQCEEMTNELGFLSKHPTTGKPVTSPFINIGINYMNQASRQWDNIMQIVKENCSVDFSGTNPNDDLERLLHQRKGF